MRLRLFVTVLAGIVCVCVIFCIPRRDRNAERCRKFLADFGWETETEVFDVQSVTIPKDFDRVYEGYNEIQREAGLDLAPYRGRKGVRYTFVVTDYPFDAGGTVYANVICIDGAPIGGDIMTADIGGFMHSLRKRSAR